MPETIVLCFPVARAQLTAARAEFPHFDWRESTPDDSAAITSAAIIYGRPGTEILKSARALKWVQSPSAGVEKWATSDAFQNGSFQLTTAAGMHESCAQHAFALLLALSRKIHLYEKTLTPGNWRSTQKTDVPLVLSGLTMGVLGLGALGRRVCEIARVFGMKTLGVSRSGKNISEADETHSIAALDTILPRCDALTLILPATPDTDDPARRPAASRCCRSTACS